VFLWLIYGVILHAWPIILANGVTLALSIAILALKLQYDRRGRAAAKRILESQL
jgi:MtN3 and saliva related transmembrane protein